MHYPANSRAIGDLARVYIAENRNNKALVFLEGQAARHPARPDILLTFVRWPQSFMPTIARSRRFAAQES